MFNRRMRKRKTIFPCIQILLTRPERMNKG